MNIDERITKVVNCQLEKLNKLIQIQKVNDCVHKNSNETFNSNNFLSQKLNFLSDKSNHSLIKRKRDLKFQRNIRGIITLTEGKGGKKNLFKVD